MQQQRSILDELKHQYKTGGMAMKLIFANVIVFTIIGLIGVVGRLAGGNTESFLYILVSDVFALQKNLSAFATHPWGLITSIFSHIGFFHVLFNMLILYSFGRLFLQFFSSKRLLYTYILGGIFGGLFEIGSTLFQASTGDSVIGASGAVMAVIFAIAVHKPQLELNLFGTFKVKLFVIAIVLFLANFLSLGTTPDVGPGTAYFAHIGGAALGFLSVQQLTSSTNIINMAQRFGDWFLSLFRKKPKLSVKKGDARRMTDEEYNEDKKRRQEQVDKILDKISKSGYESLSKKEKDFLFKQSK